jgi:hypothetical protein
MRMKLGQVLACTAALCSAIAAGEPKLMSAESWLAEVPPLPASVEGAYVQWVDAGGGLKPGPAAERVSNGLKAQILTLARPLAPLAGSAGPLASRDKALSGKISVFPDTAAVLQKIQAARTAQAALLEKWHAELSALEQRRILARTALPGCHNEAGVPSQVAIRDVELSFAQQRLEIALRYLAESRPLVNQLLAAVSPRIEHGDAAMAAWSQLRNPGARAQLAPLAREAETDALQDVALVHGYIQDISKLAARPVADRNALGRVYGNARGC